MVLSVRDRRLCECRKLTRLLASGGGTSYLMRVQVADMKRYDDFYNVTVSGVGLSDVTSVCDGTD